MSTKSVVSEIHLENRVNPYIVANNPKSVVLPAVRKQHSQTGALTLSPNMMSTALDISITQSANFTKQPLPPIKVGKLVSDRHECNMEEQLTSFCQSWKYTDKTYASGRSSAKGLALGCQPLPFIVRPKTF